MTRVFPSLILAALLFEIYSVLPLRVTEYDEGSPPYIAGSVHVALSPGSARQPILDQIAAAAERSRLGFVVLATQDKTLPESVAGTRRGVDFYPEMEISTPSGHALVFFSHTAAATLAGPRIRELGWNHFLGKESRAGMFVVAAHPSSVFHPWERLDRMPEGVELINLRSLVERHAFDSPLSFALTLAVSPFNPYLGALRLYQPFSRDFVGWDATNTVNPGHFGIVATDDLSDWPGLNRFGLLFPPVNQTLAVASTIVFPDGPLSTNFDQRRKQVYRSLREGKSALLMQAIHPFEGNDWTMTCGKKEYRSGDKFALREPGCEFVIRTPDTLPNRKRLVLLRDGEAVAEIPAARQVERVPVDKDGAYRLEVWVKQASLFRVLMNREVPYLLYNPLYVR